MHPQPALPPHSLRLADAGDAKPAWITLLTHGALRPWDSACRYCQRGKRAGQHFHRRRARLLDRARVRGRREPALGRVHRVRGARATPLLFLGLVTFGRCLQIAIDDWEFGLRIMRLRATYAQLVPELAGMLAEADADEAEVTQAAGAF